MSQDNEVENAADVENPEGDIAVKPENEKQTDETL